MSIIRIYWTYSFVPAYGMYKRTKGIYLGFCSFLNELQRVLLNNE